MKTVKSTTRIKKWGNSLALRLPQSLTLITGLTDGREVEVVSDGQTVIITPVLRSTPHSLDTLVQAITFDNRHNETDWNDPSSKEVW